MTSQETEPPPHVLNLMAAHFEGTASEDELRELEGHLAEPAMARYFVESARIHADLEGMFPARRRKPRISRAVLALAACLAISLLVWAAGRWWRPSPMASDATAPAGNGVVSLKPTPPSNYGEPLLTPRARFGLDAAGMESLLAKYYIAGPIDLQGVSVPTALASLEKAMQSWNVLKNPNVEAIRFSAEGLPDSERVTLKRNVTTPVSRLLRAVAAQAGAKLSFRPPTVELRPLGPEGEVMDHRDLRAGLASLDLPHPFTGEFSSYAMITGGYSWIQRAFPPESAQPIAGNQASPPRPPSPQEIADFLGIPMAPGATIERNEQTDLVRVTNTERHLRCIDAMVALMFPDPDPIELSCSVIEVGDAVTHELLGPNGGIFQKERLSELKDTDNFPLPSMTVSDGLIGPATSVRNFYEPPPGPEADREKRRREFEARYIGPIMQGSPEHWGEAVQVSGAFFLVRADGPQNPELESFLRAYRSRFPQELPPSLEDKTEFDVVIGREQVAIVPLAVGKSERRKWLVIRQGH